jgi:hypothetical protein
LAFIWIKKKKSILNFFKIIKEIVFVRLVIFFKVFFALKVNILSKHEYKTSFGMILRKIMYFCCFLCAVCLLLLASLINMYVPISELHAQRHWWTLNASFNSIQRSCWWPMLLLSLPNNVWRLIVFAPFLIIIFIL